MSSSISWKLYASNSEAWAAMLEDCSKATKSIVLEQFIFKADEFGTKLIDVCAERARNGVDVRFLWDSAGSFTFWGRTSRDDMKKKAISLQYWRTLMPGYFKISDYKSWYLRNHRRTLVIDEKIGYTGSICVDDSMKHWRDTNVRLEGEVVIAMQAAFDRMWWRANKRRPGLDFRQSRDPEFQYVTNNPSPNNRQLYKLLLEAVRTSEKYIYITVPYFAPTPKLLRAMKLAAYRGVDVRLLLPGQSDNRLVDWGARTYFHGLLSVGVKIFQYQGNVLHSKATVIDGTWSTVGSLNWDSASLLYNYEANIVSTNAKFAEELTAHFIYDLKDSLEVKLESWIKRPFTNKVLEFFVRLIRKFL